MRFDGGLDLIGEGLLEKYFEEWSIECKELVDQQTDLSDSERDLIYFSSQNRIRKILKKIKESHAGDMSFSGLVEPWEIIPHLSDRLEKQKPNLHLLVKKEADLIRGLKEDQEPISQVPKIRYLHEFIDGFPASSDMNEEMIMNKPNTKSNKITFKTSSKQEKNPTKKIKLIDPTKMTPSEEEFFEKVLKRGELEGWWYIKRWASGGSRSGRTAYGIDFIIQNQQTGVEIEIEVKETASPHFTYAQRRKFLDEKDMPKTAIRLCVIHPSNTQDYVVKVCYWSPNFFKTIPLDEERWKNPSFFEDTVFRWAGLGDCVKQNMENTLFNLISGDFGYWGARYELMPLENAYDWIYRKLIATIQNPLEDSNKKYVQCARVASFPDMIKEVLMEVLNESYRPLYVSDFLPTVQENFPEEVSPNLYIRGEEAGGYISHQLRDIRKIDSEVIVIPLKDYSFNLYGLKKYQEFYIPLKKVTSQLLDVLKAAWMKTGDNNFTMRELSKIAKLSEEKIREWMRGGRDELIEKKLIKFYPSRGRGTGLGKTLSIIEISDKCIEYFSWKEKMK